MDNAWNTDEGYFGLQLDDFSVHSNGRLSFYTTRFLCKVTKSLEFGPTPYLYRIDGFVPIYLCLMWGIPFFIGLAVALSVRDAMEASRTSLPTLPTVSLTFINRSLAAAPITSSSVSPPRSLLQASSWPAHLASIVAVGGILCICEISAGTVGLWHPTARVQHKLGTTALYMFPAKLLLGLISMGGYMIVEGDGW
ncbi:hypothetical protein HDU67_005416, partial [Dinochytrium kinnereticum]